MNTAALDSAGAHFRPLGTSASFWSNGRAMACSSLLIVTLLTVIPYTPAAGKPRGDWVFSGSTAAPAAAAPNERGGVAERPMEVNSSAISSAGEFPKRETCDGLDTSPPLSWSGAPAAAKSFAVILDDPDAPGGTFTHWLAWNIPARTRALAANLRKAAELPDGTRQGRNDFGNIGYGGPCPPPGKPHRYYLRVCALDTTLAVKPGAGRADVEQAMQGHVVATAELMARYGR